MVLTIYNIAVTNFFLYDKYKKYWFFKETFLLIYVRIEILLDMLFFLLFNTNI